MNVFRLYQMSRPDVHYVLGRVSIQCPVLLKAFILIQDNSPDTNSLIPTAFSRIRTMYNTV